MNTQLLIIDPQNDFCDPHGALAVAGADQDMARLATWVDRFGPKLSDIHVTLDTHHFRDIAHPVFWVDTQGNNPAPFTIISAEEVEQGKWQAAQAADTTWAKEYTRRLKTNQRYDLCIWPPHCLIGSWGTQVVEPLYKSLREWENRARNSINYVNKGSNPYTEHYSAIRADVLRNDDPTTDLNQNLLDRLVKADRIVVAGEALSHCVRFTVLDLIEQLPGDKVKQIVLLSDAMSSVAGFDQAGRDFLDLVATRGISLIDCKSADGLDN